MMVPEGKKTALRGIDIPSDEILNNCIHCGLCLATCPTYSLTGLEQSSPRGRIRLIKSVTEGSLSFSRDFIYEMNFCLDCRACETACPAGIKYGSLLESTRAQIYKGKSDGKIRWLTQWFFLNWLIGNQQRLKFFAHLLRGLQRYGLIRYNVSEIKHKVLRHKFYQLQSLIPKISIKFSTNILSERTVPSGQSQYRVLVLTGCIMDVAFSSVNEDTVKLLLRHNCEVIVPRGQGCCGSLHAHNGDLNGARKLAIHNIELFSKFEFDYIIVNSAGCSAFMKEYGEILKNNTLMSKQAKIISNRVKDIVEFLDETGFRPSKKENRFLGKKIAYHDACHSIHVQHISEQPRKLIRSVPGIEYVELHDASWCCGSAGIYNITHYTDSMQILKRKINAIRYASPDVLVTGNPGCLIQIQHGLNQEGLKIELLHTATFLRDACGI
jgi:glycolate oxidase iron-sulfur subunit